MPTYKTPDVYVEEISVFPPSVAEVETAVPAFVGYTEKAIKVKADDLLNVPFVVNSLKEYEQYYGMPKADDIVIAVTGDSTTGFVATVTEPVLNYYLYYSVKMYFDNGGGKCYIVSVATYKTTGTLVDKDLLKAGLDIVAKEDEPTLLVVPESTKCAIGSDYDGIVQKMIAQCGTLKDRFAIIDVIGGEGPALLSTTAGGGLELARTAVANNNLKYAAMYYPFLKTNINFYIKYDATTGDETNVKFSYNSNSDADFTDTGEFAAGTILSTVKSSNTALYNFIKTEVLKHYVVIPPSGAVAGIYAAVDTARGVWKAPANVSLTDVIEPAVKFDNTYQDGLNVDSNGGKSINAIRAFASKGTLVWGARTLAGNDNEWRYIPVRRFFNMVEESVKKSTYWAVFEPNDANTWVKVRGMIENYLTQKWREGALAGATTKDAFFVRCALGVTMNAQDILEGRMNVEIGMAVVRPAEFIILKFSHKLQTS